MEEVSCRMSALVFVSIVPNLLMTMNDPKLMAGAPVALQVVGPHLCNQ